MVFIPKPGQLRAYPKVKELEEGSRKGTVLAWWQGPEQGREI